jgi:signal transduction histidine kinase
MQLRRLNKRYGGCGASPSAATRRCGRPGALGSLELLHRRALGEHARTLVERGAALTGQLLAFSRHQRLNTAALDLDDLVAASAGMLRNTLGGTIRIATELDPGVWPVLADRNQLELVLLNLAINARDAMPEGGTITIATAIETTGPPQRPEHPPAGEWAAVAMTDTGSGMAPEILDRAFEPFFTTKPAGRGSLPNWPAGWPRPCGDAAADAGRRNSAGWPRVVVGNDSCAAETAGLALLPQTATALRFPERHMPSL